MARKQREESRKEVSCIESLFRPLPCWSWPTMFCRSRSCLRWNIPTLCPIWSPLRVRVSFISTHYWVCHIPSSTRCRKPVYCDGLLWWRWGSGCPKVPTLPLLPLSVFLHFRRHVSEDKRPKRPPPTRRAGYSVLWKGESEITNLCPSDPQLVCSDMLGSQACPRQENPPQRHQDPGLCSAVASGCVHNIFVAEYIPHKVWNGKTGRFWDCPSPKQVPAW